MADVKTGIGDPEIVAYELTLKDQRTLLQAAADKANQSLDDIQKAEVDPVAHLADDITMAEMCVICRCTEDDLLNLRESELVKVAAGCRRANPLFFEKRKAAAEQTRKWMESNPDLINQFLTRSGNSNAQPQH